MSERGVIVEFDFTVLNGADLLFRTARRFLESLDGIALDAVAEARYLAGESYQAGFERLFPVVKTKKTPQKAGRDLAEAFSAAVTQAVPAAIGVSFKNFVKALTDSGLKVVIATRADLDVVRPFFQPVLGEKTVLYPEFSSGYGAVKGDAWRRACRAGGLRPTSALALTGSGFGVKSALMAGMGAMAVVNDHVAYQDFGGADDVLNELSGKTARRVLGRWGL